MRLRDNDEESEFRATLRRWLRSHVPAAAPGAPRRWDADELHAWSRLLWEAGYAGLTWPVAYGGRGLRPSHQGIYAEESALAGAPDHANVIGLNMVGPSIISHGTDQQRATYLPRILAGESIFCQAFSEPEAGSDLAAVRTRAVRHPAGYQLDGVKVWSSYAHLADSVLLLARTDPSAARHRGLTCFLVDLRLPGVRVTPLRQLDDGTDFSQIIFTGVVTPEASVLGEPGAGWRVALTTLAHERGTFGITLTARLTVQFDRLVQTATAVGAVRNPMVRREIADLYADLQALRYTGYRALSTMERTAQPGTESSIIKLRWSQVHQRLTALATRVTGSGSPATGAADHWAGYWHRERLRSRASTIEGGTSEILRGIVAERVLGLPRSR